MNRSGLATLKLLLPLAAVPAIVGETTYLVLQAVPSDITVAELVRIVGAVGTTWMTVLTGLVWRTFYLTRADHQLLHGVKGAPGLSERAERMERRMADLPDDIERRFDGAVGRMQELSGKLEGRIERLEDRHLGGAH